MAGPLQFATFSSEIELPFYSALFASKLDYDKLDDSARVVLGLYEPRPSEPADSCKMQILGNALASQRYTSASLPMAPLTWKTVRRWGSLEQRGSSET